MKAIQLKSHVGHDGLLTINVPTEVRDRDVDVIVVIEHGNGAADRPSSSPDWANFVKATAGSIPDPSIFRHEQGPDYS